MKTKDEQIQELDKGAIDQLARLSVGTGLTTRSLEVFVVVARAGTMSAAAEQLGMTQPAVSQLVNQMETALGIQLFDRSKRPLALTLHGAALVEPARAIVSGIERFEQIGMLNSFAETIGPSVFAELRRSAAQLTIDSGFSATRMRAVADRALDFVITTDESPLLPGVTMAPILTEPFLIVAPESYAGDPRAIKLLSETLDLIRFGRDPFMHSRFDQTLRAWGITTASLSPGYACRGAGNGRVRCRLDHSAAAGGLSRHRPRRSVPGGSLSGTVDEARHDGDCPRGRGCADRPHNPRRRDRGVEGHRVAPVLRGIGRVDAAMMALHDFGEVSAKR